MRINPTGKDVTNVDIMPLFPYTLDSVSAYHDTPVGRISVDWQKKDNNKLVLIIDGAEKLHGKTILSDGFIFTDCTKEKVLASGEYILTKAGYAKKI